MTMEEIKKAADEGNAEAQYAVGMDYYTKGEFGWATNYFRRAAKQEFADAQYMLGQCSFHCQGVMSEEQGSDAAMKWFEAAAANGHSDAMVGMGDCWFEQGNRALNNSIQLGGDEECLAESAQCYSKGITWYRKSADRGNARGEYLLGIAYTNGTGVEQDDDEAIKWCLLSAKKGYAPAQHQVGVFSALGVKDEPNYAEAFNWYRLAAEQGYPDSQHNLAVCYLAGQGVDKDLAEAVKWEKLAAEQGHALAMYNLGTIYHDGVGVEKDYAEAAYYFEEAARQGCWDAWYNLGACYANGEGVEQNAQKAVECLLIAEHYGSEIATAILKQNFSPEDHERLIEEFRTRVTGVFPGAGRADNLMWDAGRMVVLARE